MKIFISIALLILVSGCATGPKYSQSMEQLNVNTESESQLVFFRTSESKMFLLRNAPIHIEGKERFALSLGEFSAYNTGSTRFSLRTYNWDAIGQCKLDLNLSSKGVYYFEVAPITDNFFSYMLESTTALVTPGIEITHDSVECKGMFGIRPVSRDYALPKLKNLKYAQ